MRPIDENLEALFLDRAFFVAKQKSQDGDFPLIRPGDNLQALRKSCWIESRSCTPRQWTDGL